MKWFKREAVDEPNPMLKVEHEHDWLPANDGKELVCGLCGERRKLEDVPYER